MRIPLARLLPTVWACMLLWACASPGPPLPPSLELPKPPTDLRAARKGNTVTLTWTIPARTTDRQNVRYLGPTRICRSLDSVVSQCGAAVGEAAPPSAAARKSTAGQRLPASYRDTLPVDLEQQNPTSFVTYAIEVLNTGGHSAGLSNQVRVPLAPTLPPENLQAELTKDGVLVSWPCSAAALNPSSPLEYRQRIYRRQEGSQTARKIAELDLLNCQATPVLDQEFEWEKTYYYDSTVVTIAAEPGRPTIEVEGDDSPEVKIFADDVFPPAVPSGLQAVSSGPGQQPFIDLIWAPVSDADLAGYNVYRAEDGDQPVKLNTDLVKAPAYRDTAVTSGKKYAYFVSAVDLRSNESARSEVATETVP